MAAAAKEEEEPVKKREPDKKRELVKKEEVEPLKKDAVKFYTPNVVILV